MHELKRKSSSDSFARAVRDDDSGFGLLAPPGGSPRKRHRRQLSLSSFPARRFITYALYAAALVVCALVALWLHLNSTITPKQAPVAKEIPGERIPLGQSRDRDGREVFWWEQFPR
jgi:hypothetical protein